MKKAIDLEPPKEEFNLSDRIMEAKLFPKPKMIDVIDIKEFIKKLKEKKLIHEIVVAYKNGEIDIYEMDKQITVKIDKLAGDKLVK